MTCKYQSRYNCCKIWCEIVKSSLPSRQCNPECAQYVPSDKTESEQYSKGEAREKRLQQLQDLEVKAEKQGTQEQLDKIRKLHQDLLNGKYTYCQGNAEAQKLIQKLNRQINKRNQHGKNSSDRQKNSAE